MLLEIILGFGAATCQSISYVGSRIFDHKYPGRMLNLLSLSHIIMGVFAMTLLVFIWPAKMPPFAQYALPLIECSGFYLIGQAFLFMALRTSSASRVSPLLGLKVFILALIGLLFLGQQFTLLQWTAIALSVATAAMLSQTGEQLSRKSMMLILLACLTYCLSDINIKILVGHFGYLGLAHGSALAASLSYTVCGIAAVVIFFFVPKPQTQMWKYSMPFSITWFVGTLFLFACFTYIGVVYGNIVQSSRGIISILIGAALVRYNFEHLDKRVSRKVFYYRLAAAVLMSCAIAFYYLGRKTNENAHLSKSINILQTIVTASKS